MMAIKKRSPVLQLESVTRILSEEAVPVTLVEDVSFTINRGEFVGITGPSGSGKSSLLYLMGLLDQPTKGKIIIDGTETTKSPLKEHEHIRLEKIGFIFQFHFLLPEFTALENVTLPMKKLKKMSSRKMTDRGKELLSHFGLEDQVYKYPGQMSGGERQRVAIARAMANDPLIILADEPSGSLDSKNSDIVFNHFKKIINEDQKTVIAITHEANLVQRTQKIFDVLDASVHLRKITKRKN